MRRFLPGMLHRAERAVPAIVRRGLKAIAPGWIAGVQGAVLAAAPAGLTEARIADGPLRGRRFSCRLKYEADYIFGTHEPVVTGWLTEYVQPSGVVYDIGAHAGYTALIAAGLVGASGRVIAFEPNPANRDVIARNLAANADLADRINLLEYAVADAPGTASFGGMETTGHLGERGYVVQVISLDRYVADGGPPPSVVKMDIEGGETAALAGMTALLSHHRPVLIVEVHNQIAHSRFDELARDTGYAVRGENGTPGLSAWTGRPQIYLALPSVMH